MCALYGLRRTGKTVLIRQHIASLSEEAKEETAYVECSEGAEMYALKELLDGFRLNGIRNVFIDEATAIEDFIQCGNVLARTDSLSIKLAGRDALYDRVEVIQTSYVPFGEYKRLLPGKGMDTERARFG